MGQGIGYNEVSIFLVRGKLGGGKVRSHPGESLSYHVTLGTIAVYTVIESEQSSKSAVCLAFASGRNLKLHRGHSTL